MINIFVTVLMVTTCSAISDHFCRILGRNSTYGLIYGFYTPAPDRQQKYFIVVQNYVCELEPIVNASEPKHFGYSLVFKNDKMCEQSQWFGPRNNPTDYPSSAFSVANGLVWKDQNLIGLTWWTKDTFELSSFAIGANKFPKETPKTEKSLVIGWQDFRPDAGYVTYSKQSTRFVSLFTFQKNNSLPFFNIVWKVYDMTDIEDIKDVTNRVNTSSSGDFQSDSSPHYYSVPRAVPDVKNSLPIRGLFGVPLNQQSNGTIILFQKDVPESKFRFRFYYCVTEEHILSEACNSNNESTETLKLFIDCETEMISDLMSTTTELWTVSTTPETKSSIITWIVIIVVVLIIIAIISVIAWYLMAGQPAEGMDSKTKTTDPKKSSTDDKGLPKVASNEYMGRTRSKDSVYQKAMADRQPPKDLPSDTTSIASNIAGMRSKESFHSPSQKPTEEVNVQK